MSTFVSLSANALSFSMLLFLIAAGLSLVFGMMGVLNLAHGGFVLLAAFFASNYVESSGFWLAAGLGILLAVATGFGVERALLAPLQRRSHLDQVLLTFGLALVIADLAEQVWGNDVRIVTNPAPFDSNVEILGALIPTYRLFVAAAGLLFAGLFWLFLERSRWGAVIRAAVDDREIVAAQGINVGRVIGLVFVLGALLAGVAGTVGLPILGVYHGLDFEILMPALIVVVVGGLGSVSGAFWSALLIGFVETFGRYYVPDLAAALIYLVMIAVLVVRPTGLFAPRRSLA